MRTAAFELALTIPQRIGELETLTKHARECQESNERLYNAICRACSVLLASHLESFLKELSRALTLDFNTRRGGFSELPLALQRTFCRSIVFYEGVSANDIDRRTKQLVAFFQRNSVEVDLKAFPYRENSNKNPSANFIDVSLNELGIPNVIRSLGTQYWEVVFDNDARTNYKLQRDLRRFRSFMFRYPYEILPEPYNFNRSRQTHDSASESLWHVFISEIMERRHSVVHGDTLENSATWEELAGDATKLEVLLHGMIYSSACFLSE